MTTDFYTIAEIENLQVVETTSAMNGYPQSLQKALIGFDSFEDAERIANEYGLRIELFTKRDGWQLYYRTNNRAYSAIEVSAEEYGADYRSFTASDYEDFYENEVKGMIGELDNFESAESYLKSQKEIYEAIGNLEDDEMVLTCQDKYFDTVKQYTMCHYYDTKTTVIGLI